MKGNVNIESAFVIQYYKFVYLPTNDEESSMDLPSETFNSVNYNAFGRSINFKA